MDKDIIVADIADKVEVDIDTPQLLEILLKIQDKLDHSIDITAISNNQQDIKLHLEDNNEVIESVAKLNLQEDELFWYNSTEETVGSENDAVTLSRADLEAIANVLYDDRDLASDYDIDIPEANTLVSFLEDNMNELGEPDLLEIYNNYFAEEASEEDIDAESVIAEKLHTLDHQHLVDIFEGYFSSSSAYISKADGGWVLFV